jgi:LPXTG-motif cell wall-anchored protein
MSMTRLQSRRAGTLASLTLAVALVLSAVASAAGGVDWTQHGFPNVVGQASVSATQGATLSYQGLTVTVPAGAFTSPTTFQLLEGPIGGFTGQAPAGQVPIRDFAFKAVDQASGQIVAAFAKPVLVTLKDSRIGPGAEYWNITAAGAYVHNPVAPTVGAGVLTHGNVGAAVGWVITVPALPKTGSDPLTAVLGGILVLGGAALILARRRPHPRAGR